MAHAEQVTKMVEMLAVCPIVYEVPWHRPIVHLHTVCDPSSPPVVTRKLISLEDERYARAEEEHRRVQPVAKPRLGWWQADPKQIVHERWVVVRAQVLDRCGWEVETVYHSICLAIEIVRRAQSDAAIKQIGKLRADKA